MKPGTITSNDHIKEQEVGCHDGVKVPVDALGRLSSVPSLRMAWNKGSSPPVQGLGFASIHSSAFDTRLFACCLLVGLLIWFVGGLVWWWVGGLVGRSVGGSVGWLVGRLVVGPLGPCLACIQAEHVGPHQLHSHEGPEGHHLAVSRLQPPAGTP